jgi:hypothetical protein
MFADIRFVSKIPNFPVADRPAVFAGALDREFGKNQQGSSNLRALNAVYAPDVLQKNPQEH